MRSAGDEVVQCYVKQPSASVPVPQVRLAAFKRVHVPKGGSVTVSLTVKPDDHSVVVPCRQDLLFCWKSRGAASPQTFTAGFAPQEFYHASSSDEKSAAGDVGRGGEAIYTASAAQKVEAGPIELYVERPA